MFVVLSRTLLEGEKIKIGGTVLNILKKLNGDRLMFPSLSTVEANAIGRGETAVCMMVCSCTELFQMGLLFSYFYLTTKVTKVFKINILNLFKIKKAYRNIYLQKFHVLHDKIFHIKIH
jgi:hypothetical protein